jgi:pimeloyl-ACP methyl ester carboxylesterase
MRTLLMSFAAIISLLLAPSLCTAAEERERFISIEGPQGPLKGTMLEPAHQQSGAIVLIIPGSGPTDRDGNSPLGVKAATYRLLAEALADRGITSVRIDKRGMFASATAVSDANQVTIEDYAQDAHSWVKEARRLTGARCVWLLGHSEGALVALAAAQQPEDLCGLILVAGAGRKLSEVLREQLNANPANAPILPSAMKAIDELEAGRRVEAAGMHPALLPLFRPAVQGYLIDAFSYDPLSLLEAYPGPVLVLQGGRDIQVSMADAERLASARPEVELVRLEGVNHVLKAAPVDRRANAATYADPSLSLAPTVADVITRFVQR